MAVCYCEFSEELDQASGRPDQFRIRQECNAMAGVESYAPCPCGSGEKFKWCCHKVESFADKARRLHESGQIEASLKVLDEGLRKEPGSPWLLVRKAIIQIRQGEANSAKTTLRQILSKHPKHFGALVLLNRCVLETESPLNGAGMFQEVLAAVDETQRSQLAPLATVVASLMIENHKIPSAIKHSELASALDPEVDPSRTSIRQIEASPAFAPWLKDRYALAPAPDHLDPDSRTRFDQALGLAAQGLWAKAAALFDQLASGEPGGEADFNLGLCRLWIGDETGAVEPIGRRSQKLGRTTEAVDLEILCQLIEPIHRDDRVDHVQLVWPLRNREALLTNLRARNDIHDEGPTPLEPENPESPIVDRFALLDRPQLEDSQGETLSINQVPQILGRVIIDQQIASLETFDDGRVDSLGDRFTVVAGNAIAPAHPRTKILGSDSRSNLTLVPEWLFPSWITVEEAGRLDTEQQVRMIRDIWPVTKMPYLGFRTPEKAAQDGNAEVALRAAVCQFEQHQEVKQAELDFAALRARFQIPLEPEVAPETVDIDKLPLARLNDVPVDRLDNDRLVLLYRKAHRGMVASAMETSAREITRRPELFEQGKIEPISVYSDLASVALSRNKVEEAMDWLAKGRQADHPTRRAVQAPLWDMIEVRFKSRIFQPEVWVPELAVILERYSKDPATNQLLLMNLIEMGLVRMAPNPDNPEDILLDSRPLQAVLSTFGPRVTTASGRLGVSATKPEVWTPGGPAGGSGGGLWTPGSGSADPASGDKPKLILPGR